MLQYGYKPNAEIKDVPFALDLLKDRPDDYRLMEIASAPLSLSRPFTAPPGIPVERLAILRKAFAEMFVDLEFVADCARQGLETDAPATGEQLQKIVTDAYAAPPAIIERLMKIYGSRM